MSINDSRTHLSLIAAEDRTDYNYVEVFISTSKTVFAWLDKYKYKVKFWKD